MVSLTKDLRSECPSPLKYPKKQSATCITLLIYTQVTSEVTNTNNYIDDDLVLQLMLIIWNTSSRSKSKDNLLDDKYTHRCNK